MNNNIREHYISVSIISDSEGIKRFKKAILEYQKKGWQLDGPPEHKDGVYTQKIYKVN